MLWFLARVKSRVRVQALTPFFGYSVKFNLSISVLKPETSAPMAPTLNSFVAMDIVGVARPVFRVDR
jgi:hypothetical protein